MTYLIGPEEMLAAGETVMQRRNVVSTTVTGTSGSLRLTYFTARRTESISKVRTISGGTAAGTPTLCKVGVFSVDTSGNLTLVASTANDTSLWAGTITTYTTNLSASFTKTRGQRYAVGLLFVGSTAPTFYGNAVLQTADTGTAPMICGTVGSQTDLAASYAAGAVSVSAQQPYAALLP